MAGNFVGLGQPAFDNRATKSGLWDSLELLSLAQEFTRLGKQVQASSDFERATRLKHEMVGVLGKMIQRTSRIQRYSEQNAALVPKRGEAEYIPALQDTLRRIGKKEATFNLLTRFGLREDHLDLITKQLSRPPSPSTLEIVGNPFRGLAGFNSSLGVLVEIIPEEDLRKSNPVDWHVVSVSLGITVAGLAIVFLAGALDTSLSGTAQTLGASLVASGTTVLGTELASHKK